MNNELTLLQDWVQEVAGHLQQNQPLDISFYDVWLERPTRVLTLVELVDNIADQELEKHETEFSACIVAMDICVANLQSAIENGQKSAERILSSLMEKLAAKILQKNHDLQFWMPILNSFYDAQVELSAELKQAYLLLASETAVDEDESEDSLDNIREMIQELSQHNVFEIAEHIFAQSHAMPSDFFSELLFDLFSLEEGQDIALLALMHSNPEIRTCAAAVVDQILPHLLLSPVSLSRLQAICFWYPKELQSKFKQWIRMQRRQGVVFARTEPVKQLFFRACEIDGSGIQGLILRMKWQKKNLTAGMLFKKGFGIKDIWISTAENITQSKQQFRDLFDNDLYSREVDQNYFVQMANHFLYETLSHGQMPDLEFLHIQELLGIQFKPEPLEISALIKEMTVQIHPFTPSIVADALRASSDWLKKARFTHSWFEENPEVDSEVNRCCTLEEGTKFCDLNLAMERVFTNIFEKNREKWRFHFLWHALFLQAKARPRERSWRDCLLIAYYIDQGGTLANIPVMRGVAQRSVINSMDTMIERGTYLSKL